MQNILCPLDFSDPSLNAVRYAVNIAEKFQANLIFMFILSKKNTSEVRSRTEAELRLNELSEQVGKDLSAHSTSYRTVIVHGGVVGEIADFAEENEVDLIVKGTQDVSEVFGERVKSITYDVIMSSMKTVFSIPASCEFNGLKTLVYASNFEKEDKTVLLEVLSLAAAFDSSLRIVHFSAENNERDLENFGKYKMDIESYLGYKKMKIERRVYSEKLETHINEYMREFKADVLIMASKQRNFISSVFHKSLTKQMSYSLDYPLLVYNI